MPPKPTTRFRMALILGTSLALAACSSRETESPEKPVEVGVLTVEPSRATLANELPGRLDASRIAEVRARVPGGVLKRAFTEGAEVKSGDVLFTIDPAPFRASRDSAKAALERAEANLYLAQVQVERYKPLIAANAISQQQYDNALAAEKLARADVSAARAQLETAQLNLGYATVTAPISGRIGRAMVTEGALVGQNEATPLAKIQQLDPIYADFTQSAAEVARLRRAMNDGRLQRLQPDKVKVTLVLEDGSEYARPGKLLFSDISVDESTGELSLRGEFPNPDQTLLPGTYVRVRLEQAVDEQALTVPQQAVQRDAGGGSNVLVVNAAGAVESRKVELGSVVGDRWIVNAGLKAGERIVVEGIQKVRPGTKVTVAPWQATSVAAREADRES
jgi:membrane fusion protein (multidrug efflux system)